MLASIPTTVLPENQTDWGIVAHFVSFSFLFFATRILTNFGCLQLFAAQRGLSTIRLTLFILYFSLKLTWSWWISGMIFIQWHFTVIQCVLVLCRCRSSMRFFSTLATLVPTSWTSSDRNSSLKSRALVLASKSKGFLLSLSLSQRSFFNFGGLIFSFVANFLVENF